MHSKGTVLTILSLAVQPVRSAARKVGPNRSPERVDVHSCNGCRGLSKLTVAVTNHGGCLGIWRDEWPRKRVSAPLGTGNHREGACDVIRRARVDYVACKTDMGAPCATANMKCSHKQHQPIL